MQVYELLVVLLFLQAIAVVYLTEASLVLRFIIWKSGKKGPSGFFSKPAIVVHILALVGIICILYGYFIEPYNIEVNRITLYTDRLKDTSIRIVQISDLHCDKKLRNENKLKDIINPLRPDIIVFTGDALNTRYALPVFKDVLKTLSARIGKYAVRGNYEVWFWSDIDLFSNTGFILLDDDSVKLKKNGEIFYISGTDYGFPNKYYETLKGIPEGSYSIFLNHTPDLVEDLEDLNVDLYLAGHTHGGQVALPFYGGLIVPSRYGKKYESGKYTVGETVLYVNRGVGMGGEFFPRVRFLARPEITVFDIKPMSSKR